MNGNDWERFGEEIRRTVQDAVDSRNFERLNQTISNTINQAVNDVAWNVKNNVKNFGTAMNQNSQAGNFYQKRPPILVEAPTSVKVGGIILSILGYGLGTVVFIFGGLVLIAGFCLQDFSLGFQALFALDAILFGGCALLAAAGTKMLGRLKRFKTYVRELHGREYCNVKELGNRIGKSAKYVIKDVEKMIEKGWFRQGHLDRQKTCLMITDRAYHEYLRLEDQRNRLRMEEEMYQGRQKRMAEQKKQTEQKRKQEEASVQKEKKNSNLSPEVQKVIDQGDAYIQKIHECNEAIPGEEISAKMSRMEMLVDRIFDRVEQNPESVADIRKLMEYYLPTTIKLLEAYEELDSQPVGGENIQTAKKEIEDTLDTLNMAFEKLLDSLFQDTAWDVSADISVLHTMLAQEGLTEDGLKRSEK